jgi:hypothetical protein
MLTDVFQILTGVHYLLGVHSVLPGVIGFDRLKRTGPYMQSQVIMTNTAFGEGRKHRIGKV